MHIHTIGYGGRTPTEFIALLQAAGTATVADVRMRPGSAYMAYFAKARTPDKGIEKLLGEAGIAYVSLLELGNIFAQFEDWRERYRTALDAIGDMTTERLRGLPGPVCLLCSEKDPAECHRALIAEWLQEQGWTVTHIT